MDLEQYKKTWQNQESETSISQLDIYKMAQKRSSSIVKWIFIIGIIEFLISVVFSIYNDSSYMMNSKFVETSLIVLGVLYYPFMFYFLYHFYKNYKKVSSTDNTKSLMNSILNTRKMVKLYILISLIVGGFIGVLVIVENAITDLDSIVFGIIIIAVILGFIYLIYQLIYGILLKKLYKNYEELSNLED